MDILLLFCMMSGPIVQLITQGPAEFYVIHFTFLTASRQTLNART